MLLRNQLSKGIFKFKVHRFTLIGHAGFKGLQVLLLLASDPVCIAVFDKHRAGLHEAECYISGNGNRTSTKMMICCALWTGSLMMQQYSTSAVTVIEESGLKI